MPHNDFLKKLWRSGYLENKERERRMRDLEQKLKVGTKIKIGPEYAKATNNVFTAGEVITLIEGWFENDNGLYTEGVTCPSIPSVTEGDDFDSIYHLFENDLSLFLDCEIIE